MGKLNKDKEFLQELVHTLVEENTPLDTLEEENIDVICSLYEAYLAEEWGEEDKSKEVKELLQESKKWKKMDASINAYSMYRLAKSNGKFRNARAAAHIRSIAKNTDGKSLFKIGKVFGLTAAALAVLVAPSMIGSAAGSVAGTVATSFATSAAAAAGSGAMSGTSAVAGGALSAVSGIAAAVGTFVLAPVIVIAGLLSLALYVENLISKKKFREAFLKEVKDCLGQQSLIQVQALLLAVKNSKEGEVVYEKAQESLDAIRQELLTKCGDKK